MTPPRTLLSLLFLAGSGCADVERDHDHHDHELISTVALLFTHSEDGTTQAVSWTEADGQSDDILLTSDASYRLSVSFLNEYEDPADDITDEVRDEAEEHQVFYTGTAVTDGFVEVSYEDSDPNGLPLGLETTVVTTAQGSSELTVTLRHMPPEDGAPVKRDDMAEDVAEGGLQALAGEGANDVSVDFSLAVGSD